MIRPRLVLCSGVEVPPGRDWAEGREVVRLDTLSPGSNTHLRIENVTDAFARRIPKRFVDLLEIATYVYAADCEASRERAWMDDKATEPWSRDFRFVVPVRDFEFWQKEDVQKALVEALDLLSSDEFYFTFCRLKKDRPVQEYLQIVNIEDSPFYGIDRVTMFSGGLDSLAGAVETVAAGSKLVAVSHRPAVQTNKRQRELFRALRGRFDVPMMHVPVWVNKSGFDRESTQRTRTFLFSALGATVAFVLRPGGIRFPENGVTSLNWPLAAEVLRTRASRTTHPEALKKLETFYRLIVDSPASAIENPCILKTKTEVVSVIDQHGAGDLIGRTCSCTHTMFQPKTQWHCERCGQCIDRRIAILAAGLEQHDSEDDYVNGVFTRARKEGYDRNIAVNYVRFASELNQMSEAEIAATYNLELIRAARCFDAQGEAAQWFIEMHKRHAQSVCGVLDAQLKLHTQGLLDSSLEKTSLLAAIGRQEHQREGLAELARIEVTPSVATQARADQYVFRKMNAYWELVYEGKRGTPVPDAKGMPLIAYLLAHPHREYDPLELKRLVDGVAADPGRSVEERKAADADLHSVEQLGGDAIMDPKYQKHVKKLIREADAEVTEAERLGDPVATAEAKRKRQELFAAVAGGLGKGGRIRRFRGDVDKARDTLVKRVKRALTNIQQSHLSLHAHLSNSLTLSSVFAYKPDRSLSWLTG